MPPVPEPSRPRRVEYTRDSILRVIPLSKERLMDAGLKHREFIQRVVDRLASDSFRKTIWTVVVVTPLLVLLGWHERIRRVGTNG